MSDIGKRLLGDLGNAKLIARSAKRTRDKTISDKDELEKLVDARYRERLVRIPHVPPVSKTLRGDTYREVAIEFARKVVAESPAPLSEPTNCPECKSESKRYSVCISHKNAKECRYAGSPCVLCRNSWHESHSLPEPPTGLLQGRIGAAPLSEEAPTPDPSLEDKLRDEIFKKPLITVRSKAKRIKALMDEAAKTPASEVTACSKDDLIVRLAQKVSDLERDLEDEQRHVGRLCDEIRALSAPKSPAFSEEAARREFEEWAKSHRIIDSSELDRDSSNEYYDIDTEHDWQVWLACAKRRAEV